LRSSVLDECRLPKHCRQDMLALRFSGFDPGADISGVVAKSAISATRASGVCRCDVHDAAARPYHALPSRTPRWRHRPTPPEARRWRAWRGRRACRSGTAQIGAWVSKLDNRTTSPAIGNKTLALRWARGGQKSAATDGTSAGIAAQSLNHALRAPGAPPNPPGCIINPSNRGADDCPRIQRHRNDTGHRL
jgi:hypothetical protein